MKTAPCTDKKVYAFNSAPRCGAKSRRNNGRPCMSPAVRGKKRCRMHGGSKGSGALRGNRNALKHGFTTAEAKVFKNAVRLIIKENREIERDLDI